MVIDRMAARRVPDVIEGVIPSGIMTLAVTDDVAAADAIWAHGRWCVAQRRFFLDRQPVRRGGIEVLRPRPGDPHGILPTPMYMATALVWLDLTHLDDVDHVDARLHELRDVFGRMVDQHWHAVQPAFVVAISDVFECGPFGALDLARSFFGPLALAGVYVEAHGEDAPDVVVHGAEQTLTCAIGAELEGGGEP